jgi:hypothetical protein
MFTYAGRPRVRFFCEGKTWDVVSRLWQRAMGPDTVRSLRVWQEGVACVKEVYSLIAGWPKRDIWTHVRFSRIALGSAFELDTLLETASELGFPHPITHLLR